MILEVRSPTGYVVRGAKSKAELNAMGSHVPEYWVTGVGYCSLCGASLEGVSGTSKRGRKYRYYYCFNQHRKKCTLKPVGKDALKNTVESIIDDFLGNPEPLTSLAAEYKTAHGRNEAVMEALELERKDVERQMDNFVKAIAQGVFSTPMAQAMNDLEQRKSELDTQIQTAHVKNALMEDEGSIGAFFKKFE